MQLCYALICQSLGSRLRIVGNLLYIRAVARHKGRQNRGSLRSITSVQACNQLRNVHCLRKCFSYLRIRDSLGVVSQIVDIHTLSHVQQSAGRCYLVYYIGVDSVDDVNLAVGQSNHAGGVVGDGLEYDLLCNAFLAPVILIALHYNSLVLVPSDKLVGTGSAGSLV